MVEKGGIKQRNLERQLADLHDRLAHAGRHERSNIVANVLSCSRANPALLLPWCTDSATGVRWAAAHALGSMGITIKDDETLVSALVSMLADRDLHVAATAAWALGHIHATLATPFLQRYLQTGTPEELLRPVIWALAQISDITVLPALVELFSHAPEVLVKPLSLAIASFGGAAVEPLLQLILTQPQDESLRSRVGETLMQIGAPAAPALCLALSSSGGTPVARMQLRRIIAYLLGHIPPSVEVVRALVELSRDDDEKTRINSVRALAVVLVSGERHKQPLINITPSVETKTPGTAEDSAGAEDIIRELVLSALEERLTDPRDRLKERAINALGDSSCEQAAGILQTFLDTSPVSQSEIDLVETARKALTRLEKAIAAKPIAKEVSAPSTEEVITPDPSFPEIPETPSDTEPVSPPLEVTGDDHFTFSGPLTCFISVLPGLEEITQEILLNEATDLHVVESGPGYLIVRVIIAPAKLAALRTAQEVLALPVGAGNTLIPLPLEPGPEMDSALASLRNALPSFISQSRISEELTVNFSRPSLRASTIDGRSYRLLQTALSAVLEGISCGDGVIKPTNEIEESADIIDLPLRAVVSARALYCGVPLLDSRSLRSWRHHTLPASIDPTLAAALVFLSQPGPEDVFLDPMCGAGTILLERAAYGPVGRLSGGDIDPHAVQATLHNFVSFGRPLYIQTWDATELSLPDSSVDVIITNLPFGRRVGNHQSNAELYKPFLLECLRLLRPEGRAVLLTQEKRLLSETAQKIPGFKLRKRLMVEAGGMRPDIFVFTKQRRNAMFQREVTPKNARKPDQLEK